MARGYTRVTLPIALTVTCLIASLGPGQRSQARTPAAAGPSVALRRAAALSANPAGRANARPTVLRASSVGRHGVAFQRVGRDGDKPDAPREVARLRTRNSDTFVGADGVYTVHQSFESINYQDAQGAWQPISNTLVPAAPALTAQGFAYQNKANGYTVAFSAGTSSGSTLERITRHGVTLDLSPVAAQVIGDSALTAKIPASLAVGAPALILIRAVRGQLGGAEYATANRVVRARVRTVSHSVSHSVAAGAFDTPIPPATSPDPSATSSPMTGIPPLTSSAIVPTPVSTVTTTGTPTPTVTAGTPVPTSTAPISDTPAPAPTGTIVASRTPAVTGDTPATSTVPAAAGGVRDATIPMSVTVDPRISAPIVAGDTITYTNLYTATDAVYNVRNDAVKESLILHDASAPSSFTFAVRVDGAQPHMIGPSRASGARTLFIDAAGREQLALEPLVAVDAQGATTPVSLTLSPATGTSAVRLQATIPASWLGAPDRAWPVALDPSVFVPYAQFLQIDSQNLKPQYYGRLGDLVYRAYGLGYQPESNAPATTVRLLAQFGFSALPPHVTLLNAQFSGWVVGGPPGITANASVYPLTSAWTTNATWQTSDGTTNWATPGGDYDPTSRVTANLTGPTPITVSGCFISCPHYSSSKATWDITPLARRWYANPSLNRGVLIRLDDESPSSGPYVLHQPTLQATYSYIPWQGGAAPGGARAFDPHAALKSDRSLITFPQGDG